MRTNMQEVWTAGDTREGITSLVNYPEFFPAYDAIKRHGFNAISGAEWAQDIEAILNRFLNVDRHRDIRVLSIGSGNGNVDEPVIDTLAKMTTGKVLYCAIDPDSAYLQKFRELALSRSDNWQNVEIEFRVESMEEYSDVWDKRQMQDKFNLIFASYVIYHFRDVKATLVKMDEMLKTNGMTYFKINSGGWGKLMEYWSTFYHDSSHRLFRYGPETVKKMLREVFPNIKLEGLYRNAEMDITECFDENSEDGKLMLDFLMQMRDFRKVASPGKRDNLIKFLRDECCYISSGKIILTTTDEHVYFVT